MNDVSPGKLTMLIGAAVTVLFSWFPWISFSGFGSNYNTSAWGSGLFPMASWTAVFALIVGVVVALDVFKLVELPEKIWEFTRDQVVLILSIFALLIALSYLIVDKSGASIGFGLILCILGTAAMIAGYFMDKAGVGVNANAANGNATIQQPGFTQPGVGNQAPPAQTPPAQAPPPPTEQPPPPDPGTF